MQIGQGAALYHRDRPGQEGDRGPHLRLLYESGVNIEDISQGITEGYFVMTMAVDMRDANRHLETLSASLQRPGEEMG